MERRPPLPMSPRRLRPRNVLRPDISCRTPQGTAPAARSVAVHDQPMVLDDSTLRDEYLALTSELQAIARSAKEQFGLPDGIVAGRASLGGSMFERGRMYDLYTARRNERLKRRKGEEEAEERRQWDLGVCNSGLKKTAKRAESVRKSAPVESSVVRSYGLRSSVKSIKELKEIGSYTTPTKSAVGPVKRATVRSAAVRSCRRDSTGK